MIRQTTNLMDRNMSLMDRNTSLMDRNTSLMNRDTSNFHSFRHHWVMWGHMPPQTNTHESVEVWTNINYYKQLYTFTSAEEVIALRNLLKPVNKLFSKYMLFIMLKNVQPIWEDPVNCNGGAFSYKISNTLVYDTFWTMVELLCGGTLGRNQAFTDDITGITVSPKKEFCILKIWCRSCYANPMNITDIKNIVNKSWLFSKHSKKINK